MSSRTSNCLLIFGIRKVYTSPMQEPSIFTKIINGDIPSYKVYEDDYAFAFLDIFPIEFGQVLVVPKKQVSFVWDLEPADYQGLMNAVKKVGQRIREVFPQHLRVGVMIEGIQVANHAHVKVFPFSTGEQFRHDPTGEPSPSAEALTALAEKLRFS